MGLLKSLRNAAKQLIGVETVKQLVGFVEHTAQAGTHILGMSTALGMSTDAFQSWSYVAKRAGSDATQFATGVSMFERNLLEFSKGRGSKRFADAMAQVGISSGEARGFLAGPDGVNAAIFKVADAYQRMGNNAQRAAINTSLFGQRARGMAQDLSQGGTALREQIAHIHAIGGIVDEKSLQNLKGLNNGIVDMKAAFSGLSTQVIGRLAPHLTELADAAARWIYENRDLIDGVIEAAVTALSTAFEALGAIVDGLANLIRAAMGGDEGATAILIGLAVAIGSIVVPALGAMAVAVIAATWPFLAIAAVVAAIAYGILQLVKHWDVVKAAAKAFLDWVIEGFEEFGDFLYDTFVQPWIDAWEKVKSLALDAWNYVKSLDWVDAIPILGDLVGLGHKMLGHKIGHKLNPDAFDDGMDGMQRIEHPDGSVSWVDTSAMAAPANASPRGPVGGGGAVNVQAPLNVTINGVPDAPKAVEGFENALDRHMRHAFAGTGGGGAE
jgi:hypothetical protein